MTETQKTAIIFGATGLVGGHLLSQLLESNLYSKVLVFVRHSTGISHEKMTEHIINFEKLDDFSSLMIGNDVFSCYGTNILRTRDKTQWRFSDVDLAVRTAEICFNNGASGFAVVSSIGANANGSSFYLKLKGEMEESVKKIGFERLAIVRPSFLLGKRKDFRIHEEPARWLMQFLGLFMWGKAKNYKAIHARVVARAMIHILNSEYKNQQIFTSGELREMGK